MLRGAGHVLPAALDLVAEVGYAKLSIAVELIWPPLAQRWLNRGGPLSHAYADALVDTALRGLRPRPT